MELSHKLLLGTCLCSTQQFPTFGLKYPMLLHHVDIAKSMKGMKVLQGMSLAAEKFY